MRFISHIVHFLKKFAPAKKYLLMGLVFFAGYTFAADTTKDSDVIAAIVQVLNFLFTVITFLLTPAVILAGWLLSPDWTMGDFFGLRPYFIQVWVLVSNLVYIIFALMLLWMAVMQIFSSESNYAFKKKLPHFLVGIMIVPFTWLFVSWTLSFANQAVAAVLSIPSGAIASMQKDDKGVFHLRTIPTKFTLDFSEDAPGANPETMSCADNGETEEGNIKCISPAEFISRNSSGPFFIIMVYAYDIFKIQKTEMVDFAKVCGGTEGANVDSRTCVSSLLKLLRKFGVAFITTTFFAIILIALCWVLLSRAFKLWIYVMFSPLFGLAYAVSDGELSKEFSSEGSGEGVNLGEFGFKPFFSLAMVPVLVSAVLSFGLLFIGVVNNTFTSGSLSDNGSGTFCTTGEFMVKYCIKETGTEPKGYSSYIVIGTEGTKVGEGSDSRDAFITFEFGSMLSEFVGNSGGKTLTGGAQGFADGANDIFAHIILSLIALAVMWMGVKVAVSHDEVTKAAFAPFEKFGNSVGNFVQHIPSYLPTPHPAFAAFNPAIYDAVATKMNKNVNETVEASRNKNLAEIFGSEGINSLNQAASNLNGSAEGIKAVTEKFASLPAGERDVAKAFDPIKRALNQAVAGFGLQGAELSAFNQINEKLQQTNTRSEAAQVLRDNPELVNQIKNEGVKDIFTQIQSAKPTSTSSAGGSTKLIGSDSFKEHTIDGSVIKKNGAAISGSTLTSPQKSKIRELFPDKAKIGSMSIDEIKTKLSTLDLPQSEINEITSSDQARAIASGLLDASIGN